MVDVSDVGVRLAVAICVLVPIVSPIAHAERLVFVQRDGVHVKPGADDAAAHTSSIVPRATTIKPWDASDEVWAETLACLRRIYAPFAVTITEDDPGDTPYIAAVFGGTPLQLGLARNVRGYAPLRSDCSLIESGYVFAFTELEPDAAAACRTMAQEIGHSYGLDHELREGDVMSVQAFDGERSFGAEVVACGESSARPCGPSGRCRASQSSYRVLADRLGVAGEGTPIAGAGCSSGGSPGPLVLVAISTWIGRARARRRGARAPR